MPRARASRPPSPPAAVRAAGRASDRTARRMTDAGAGAMVRVTVADAVASVTLARPRMHNALVPELLLELCVALESVARRDDVRAVLLLAEGESFSIGGDMRRFAARMATAGLEAYSAE